MLFSCGLAHYLHLLAGDTLAENQHVADPRIELILDEVFAIAQIEHVIITLCATQQDFAAPSAREHILALAGDHEIVAIVAVKTVVHVGTIEHIARDSRCTSAVTWKLP